MPFLSRNDIIDVDFYRLWRDATAANASKIVKQALTKKRYYQCHFDDHKADFYLKTALIMLVFHWTRHPLWLFLKFDGVNTAFEEQHCACRFQIENDIVFAELWWPSQRWGPIRISFQMGLDTTIIFLFKSIWSKAPYILFFSYIPFFPYYIIRNLGN